MPAAEWIDVEERQDLVVLVDLMARDLARDDFLKDGIGHGNARR
jgi:hypothetical protein